MFIVVRSLGFALVLTALCLCGRTAHAQAAPVQYWLPSSSFGFGGTVDQGVDGEDAQGRPSGWFVANTRSSLNMNSFNRFGAFGNFGSLSTEGVQFGYNLKNAPVSIYAGFDTLKYNNAATPLASGTHPSFAAFDRSSTAPGAFSTNGGVEFRPTSNLSLSFGASFTQQQSQGLVDSDINSPLLPGQSPLTVGGVRR